MTFGSLLMSAGFIAASFATSPWHLYLSQGVAVGTGLGAIFIPSVQVLPQWFLRRRSLAGGIASAGSGFGGLAFALGTDAMIRRLSLAWALRITGCVCLGANLLGTALIRDRNALVKPPQLGFATHLLRRYDCLLLLAWAFTNVLGYIVILYSVSAYAVQVAGLTQARAGILTAVLNLGTGVGRPAAGLVSDAFGRVWVAAWMTLACSVSVFAVWIPAESFAVLVVFSLVSGGILGGECTTMPREFRLRFL
jgi:nitrate/nitrite transporter NarK